ncbi:hypothetical protein P4E94_13340 [Pontiellaceae bacterium B12219]|nr:hypothetical protein [Pontiellaceae bacterium B12219]
MGKFKASRGRLFLWILIPPFLIAGIGLTSFALKLQSDWKLERTRAYASVLPEVAAAKRKVETLISTFNNSEAGRIKTEDELISFLQSSAQDADFMVDTLKVERKTISAGGSVPVLLANVRGSGSFEAIQNFLSEATSRQQLLTESSLQISRGGQSPGHDACRADISFELILFKLKTPGGGA